MRTRDFTLIVVAAIIAAAAALPGPAVTAQAPAGQAYTPPRTPAGHPDLQGVWRAWNLAQYDLEAHGAKPGVPAGLGFVVDPADGRIPYQPAALAKRRAHYEGTKTADPLKHADPLAKCYLPGVPRITYLGFPFQIIQAADAVTFSYEWSHKKRLVPVTKVAPPPEPEADVTLNWMGIPRGRWDGNTLVVDNTNFNGYAWLDAAGNYSSAQLKVTERYSLLGPDTLQYEATMTDPKVFTRPWTIRMQLQRQKDVGLLDYECTALLDELGIHHTWEREFEPPDL
jgi:hypothetical protein